MVYYVTVNTILQYIQVALIKLLKYMQVTWTTIASILVLHRHFEIQSLHVLQ